MREIGCIHSVGTGTHHFPLRHALVPRSLCGSDRGPDNPEPQYCAPPPGPLRSLCGFLRTRRRIERRRFEQLSPSRSPYFSGNLSALPGIGGGRCAWRCPPFGIDLFDGPSPERTGSALSSSAGLAGERRFEFGQHAQRLLDRFAQTQHFAYASCGSGVGGEIPGADPAHPLRVSSPAWATSHQPAATPLPLSSASIVACSKASDAFKGAGITTSAIP